MKLYVCTYFAPLNSEIVERKVVTQSAILPGIRSDGIKFAQVDAMQSIILGKKNWIISNSYILVKNNSNFTPECVSMKEKSTLLALTC